ncbi:MAG: primosomal protein N', partial [Gammaproteobacteria bacterium]|nr:primosomal protein N' [Gammaproteobacteria bacterium]
QSVGIVVQQAQHSALERSRLRRINKVLDTEPIIDDSLMKILGWAAAYYQQAPGEVYATALPALLRSGRQTDAMQDFWTLTSHGRDVDIESIRKRAPRQAAALDLLSGSNSGCNAEQFETRMGDGWRGIVRTLQKKDWIRREQRACETAQPAATTKPGSGPTLSSDQALAVEKIAAGQHEYATYLLNGVTGSGKTEVYLQLIDRVLKNDRQALVLVPEIGLTPQLVARFRRRLDQPLVVLHSALSDVGRLQAWRAIRSGSAKVVVGTRSAIFAPLCSPGIIIVDEEHDTSYKQQEGFRYSARDLATMRGRELAIPVVLGSATPSLESLHNVNLERYQQINLPSRAGGASMPTMHLLDMRKEPLNDGLSGSLINAMRKHLSNGNQVLLFLNRRGFAPVWFCPDCAWISKCRRCDAHMTLHQTDSRLRCHHCGSQRPAETTCPECTGTPQAVGMGTQRVEESIAKLFPDYALARIDRDSTRKRGSMEKLLSEIHEGKRDILVGTQMLTKGHHFPAVTLVGIIDADQGLFGTDPRSSERLAQLLVQVAGRAGRAEQPGEVLIQTHCPDHPLLNILIREGYGEFAEAALRERQAANWPPYASMALLRAESENEKLPQQFLAAALRLAGETPEISLLGPVPAPMARRAGRYRAQLLLLGARGPLQRFLRGWTEQLYALENARRVRWSLDVDPADLF